MKIDFNSIRSFADGKAGFMVGLFEQMRLPQVFDKHLTQDGGRPPEIPYGILAEMMLVNMTDEHHPLSRQSDYFAQKDIESLFGISVSLDQLNDDRFGGFLDLMHKAGPSLIFSEIAANAFARYGITVKNINFDTTSKVMWGQYETEEGIEGVVQIDYGYSKQKRGDKKQIKISLGTANGIVVDGQILSGNMDDKTYNLDNMDRIPTLLSQLGTPKSGFYYIADSAAFSLKCIQKALKHEIHLITRMSDNVNEAKVAIQETAKALEELTLVEIENTNGTGRYHLKEQICNYHGIPLKLSVCYSEGLLPTKKRTQDKRVGEELDALESLAKSLAKRQFACLADAEAEWKKLLKKELKKLKFHQVSLNIEPVSINRRGRPSADPEKNIAKTVYILMVNIEADQKRIKTHLAESCIFVLCSTDINLSAEEILREYKTQGSVEKKFQQLKSPQFVNSLYVETPERVEALGYLMLISLMTLSVAEHVVRRGLKAENDFIIGPGKVKMTRPSMQAIHYLFFSVQTTRIMVGTQPQRGFNAPLKENLQKIMKHLGIPQDIFIRGVG